MFVIKVVRQGGYTAYCGEIFEVIYEPNRCIKINITPRPNGETFNIHISPKEEYKTTIYIENPHGKTIETIRLPMAKSTAE